MADGGVIGVEVDLTVIRGRGLVAKDGSGMFKLGKKTSSDPYVKVSRRVAGRSGRVMNELLGQTKVVTKNLSPEWNASFKLMLEGRKFSRDATVLLSIYDQDKSSQDDPMGEVELKLSDYFDGRVSENWHAVRSCSGCSNATGDLELRIVAATRKAVSLEKNDSVMLTDHILAVGLGWDMIGGDDEVITVDLTRVPASTVALFFIATVASESRSFKDVKSAKMRLVEWHSGAERCRFLPALSGPHTALIMARVARYRGGWALSTIGDFDHTARDWGTLAPEIKGYMVDLVPKIRISPTDRVAVMRKGGYMRVRDYAPVYPPVLVLGLAWDVTNGVNIDLDASAIMLDANLRQLDIIFYGKLASGDGSIRREGDAAAQRTRRTLHARGKR